MFWNKKHLDSKEYNKLLAMIEEQRIKLEAYKLDVELYKRKLRIKSKLDPEEETQNINNSVLLPE